MTPPDGVIETREILETGLVPSADDRDQERVQVAIT
jgi:hypothetical protein